MGKTVCMLKALCFESRTYIFELWESPGVAGGLFTSERQDQLDGCHDILAEGHFDLFIYSLKLHLSSDQNNA